MNIDNLRLIFEYNEWANQRILAAAEQLSPEQLKAPNELGWGSLYGMLVHILDAEYGWRRYLADRTETPLLEAEDFDDLAAIATRWAKENDALRGYLNRLTDDDLNGLVDYEVDGETRYHVLWHCLFHMANHGTQHRSECAALLTGFGASPGDMDFTVFLSSR